ncbi:hypothetical protein [Polyangium spumosum]|uniref:Uncharacterized protein n=1 Tax=Polyangium spumosum TaxID=889282 RepID=A0A6N7PLV9_9BACT|nr:hypothetical protein [Polyangium spumosum]MRG93132.1 hypothetical protein [Polyangium spumosum]
MKRSQARKREATAPAPKKGFAKLITLFVRPRNDVPEAAAKAGPKARPPRPMPVPFVLPTRAPSAPSAPESTSDPILRSVLSALAPEPDGRAPDALRERLVAWADDTADAHAPEIDAVLEALAPEETTAPAALRDNLVAWAADTAEPRPPAPLDASAPVPPSLWQKLRRLACVLLDRLRSGR